MDKNINKNIVKNIFVSTMLLSTVALSAPAFALGVEVETNLSVSVGIKGENPQVLAERVGTTLLMDIRKNLAVYKKDPSKLYARADEIVGPHVDMERMSALVLAQNWKTATPEQKTRFAAAFKKLLLRTYGNAVLSYQDADIKWLPMRKSDKPDRALVESQVTVKGRTQPVDINYNLAVNAESKTWEVYDVKVEGISLVTNYRSTYATEIQKTSLEALIKRLEK